MDTSGLFNRYKYKLPIILSLVGVVLICGGLFLSRDSNESQAKTDFPKESLVQVQKITIDISGAVINPGVYQLNNDARVEDALKAAGGFDDKVNSEYVSKSLNLAQKVSDGMKIYIPYQGEQMGGVSAGSVVGVNTQNIKINLNSSSQAELESLPGIGPVSAGKIISSRPYNKLEDILDQKIITKTVFEKIKEQITL